MVAAMCAACGSEPGSGSGPGPGPSGEFFSDALAEDAEDELVVAVVCTDDSVLCELSFPVSASACVLSAEDPGADADGVVVYL